MSEVWAGESAALSAAPIPLGTNAVRTWRRLAVMATVVLFLATHWPLGEFAREWAGSDKLIHASVFAALTALWWKARFTRRAWSVGAGMALWAAFDEVTQMVPILNRHTALDDYLADLVGIVFVAANIELRRGTVRSVPGQWRLVLNDAAERSLLDRPFTWMALCATGALGVVVGVPLAMVLGSLRNFPPLPSAALGALLGGWIALLIALTLGISHERAAMRLRRACPGCGAGVGETQIGDNGGGYCAACSTRVHAGLWVEAPREPGRVYARRPMPVGDRWRMGGEVMMAVVLTVAILTWLIRAPLDQAAQLNSDGSIVLSSAAGRIETVLAFAGVALFMGVPILGLRRRADRTAATEGTLCMWCDHDLRGTAAERGVGVCPECGKQFARFTAPPPRH